MQSGAEKQHPSHVSRSQVPSKLRKRGAGFGGRGDRWGTSAPRPGSPKHGAPPRPGPAPAPKEEDGDPQEEKVKEGPYPAGSGRGARRGVHHRPRRHRETPARGRLPESRAAARLRRGRPSATRKEHAKTARRGGAEPEERRGQRGGGAPLPPESGAASGPPSPRRRGGASC